MSATLPFPESQQMRVQRIDAELQHLLMSGANEAGLYLDEEEKAVLRCIRFRRGLANAVPIREVQQRTSLGPRAIKEIVRTLRLNFRLPIGSSKRGAEGGYYVMVCKEDLDAWVGEVVLQIRAEAELVRSAAGPHAMRELLGQLTLEGGNG